MNSELNIAGKRIGESQPTYFIADIGANHDGDLSRAKDLILACADSGADAAKFQHFQAETIVSDRGFRSIGSRQSHQASWKKSVYEVYEEASISLEWTHELIETCRKAGVAFFTSPYSIALVDALAEHVPAFKVGSGDITWLAIIRHMASFRKPMIIATGASTFDEVASAVAVVTEYQSRFVLMQCNTNYTASRDNFKHINLNVLRVYRECFPQAILGLSDHTPGHATVLGAVALGARVIEKHFTDDNDREGPDHKFAMNPCAWREMVDRTRELEAALGSCIKQIEANESDTVVLQRRCLRAARDLRIGEVLAADDVIALRPAPDGSLAPNMLENVIGREVRRAISKGTSITWAELQ